MTSPKKAVGPQISTNFRKLKIKNSKNILTHWVMKKIPTFVFKSAQICDQMPFLGLGGRNFLDLLHRQPKDGP